MNKIETKAFLRTVYVIDRTLLLIFASLIIVIGLLIFWMVGDLQEMGQALASAVGYGSEALRSWQSYTLATLSLVQIGIWMAVVWYGRHIFVALKNGDINEASIAAGRTAKLLWVMLIWSIITHMLGTVVSTWHFPEGQRALGISLGSAQISTLLAALLATFTSHAFVLGAELWQDHQEVI